MPALRPERVVPSMFLLADPLSSTASAATALFGDFAGTTGPYDFPRSCISGLWPQPSLSGPPGDHLGGRLRALPVLAREVSIHALVLRLRGVHLRLAR